MKQAKHHTIRHFLLTKVRVALYLSSCLLLLLICQGTPMVLAQGSITENIIMIDDSTVRLYNSSGQLLRDQIRVCVNQLRACSNMG